MKFVVTNYILFFLIIVASADLSADYDQSEDIQKQLPKWIVIQVYDQNFIGEVENKTNDLLAKISIQKSAPDDNHTDKNHHEPKFEKPEDHDDEEHHDDGDHAINNDVWFWTCTINGSALIIFIIVAWMRKKAS